MNILNYDIKKTKLFKKIMISICSMIMVFASCFAPYSKVKALVGIDDVALSYVALSVLGLCGITLAGTTLSNTDITKLGSDVAGSISRTFDTLGKTVSDKWNLLVQTAGATGKIALDYVNDLKVNIQDWWNSLGSVPESLAKFNAITGMTLHYTFNSTEWKNHGYSWDYFKPSSGRYKSYFYFTDTNILLASNNNAFPIIYKTAEGLYFGFIGNTDHLFSINSYSSYVYDCYLSPESEPIHHTKDNLFSISSLANVLGDRYLFVYDTVNGCAGKLTFEYKNYTPVQYQYINDSNLQLGLDSKLTGSFKLDDRVLGATGALSLADKIIGAVGSLDLDLTNDVVNSYGYVDVPSTTLDYPYTGTWDSTLDGIGAIAWAPSTDIPIADTNVIAPTIGGTTDTDIPKVKDFTGEGSQLSFDWKGVFPFCIPFDLIAFLKCLCADLEAPKIDIPFNVPILNYKGSVSIDLSKYDEVAALCRTLFDLLFIVGLAYATRYLIKG